MTQISHLTPISTRLIQGLQRLQATGLDLPLIPLNDNKQPLGDGWQNRPLTAAQLIDALQNSGVTVPIQGKTKKILLQGFGLLTGKPITRDGQTYYLMALDQDGESAIQKIRELSNDEPLPKTVAFSSGRPGRCQYLFLVREEYSDAIRTKKIKTGIKGDDGKIEQVEFRWSNLQSVLPPSVHPTTGQYHWISGCALDETPIAIAPAWVIEQMLIAPTVHTPPLLKTLHQQPLINNFPRWTDIDFAISYLNALSSTRADDYDEWLNVGMALHSVDDSLIREWDSWSQQSSKYQPGACEKKWKSFSHHGGVTLGTLAHLAKLDGWQFPLTNRNGHHSPLFGSNPFLSRPQKPTVTGDTSRPRDTSKSEPLSLSATVTTVTTILKAGLKDYEERAELDAVAQRSSMSQGAFTELVKAIRCELDEIQPEDTQRLNQLLDWHNATLDFNQILPKPLANAFIHDAQILNIDPVSLWQYLLPTVLSLAGKKINLDAESHQIPAILWTCLVAESGTGKTRAENVILSPIKQKQFQEYKRFKEAVQQFKEQTRNSSKNDSPPLPPKPEKKYLFEIATIQSLMYRLSEQEDNGSLWARDEIAGLFKSLKQFSKQDNEAVECLLKMWDGTGTFVERMDAANDSYSVFETRLNIAGGIQPGAFRQAFKDPEDAQGLQARFLYALPKILPAKRVRGYCVLSEMLPPLYQWLENLPPRTLKLSPDANNRYTHLVEQIGRQAESCPTHAVRAWMRKLPTQLLRIALALHLLQGYYHPQDKNWEISLETLEKAVEVCRYYRSVFQVVQEKVAETDSISSFLLKIWDLALLHPNGVTPRDVYRSLKALNRRAAELGRSVTAYTIDLMTQLVTLGKGTIEKTERTVRFKASLNPTIAHPEVEFEATVNPDVNQEPSPLNLEPNSDLPQTNPSLTASVGNDEGLNLSEPLVECVPSNPVFPKGVTEVTEAVTQSKPALEPSQESELSPVTDNFELSQIPSDECPSQKRAFEFSVELSPEIPQEFRESVAEVCDWITYSMHEGIKFLQEVMPLVKTVFAEVPQARVWIGKSLSHTVCCWLRQNSPDDYYWLVDSSG